MNWGIEVLQTSALPLGYSAKFVYIYIYANLEKIFIKNFAMLLQKMMLIILPSWTKNFTLKL